MELLSDAGQTVQEGGRVDKEQGGRNDAHEIGTREVTGPKAILKPRQ